MVRTKKILTILLSIAVIMTLTAVIFAAYPDIGRDPVSPQPAYLAGYATDAGVVPVLYPGNTPNTVPGYSMGFKADYNASGFDGPNGLFNFVLPAGGSDDPFEFYVDSNTDRVLKVWLTTEGGYLHIARWEAENFEIKIFMVKGGSDFLAYFYNDFDPALMSDEYLVSPRNPSGNPAGLSHFTIFYTAPTVTTTTTGGEETTTTGGEETTTTGGEETTTTEGEETTTTGGEETTTTEGEETTTTEGEETTTTEGEETTTTFETIVVTTPSIPQVTETTVVETTTVAETTIETIVVTTEPIPQTGQTGGGQTVLIGLVLLGLAGSMLYILHRRRYN